MDLRQRWPILDSLCACVGRFPGVEIWVFGSMLWSEHPNDLDVLIIYTRLEDVISIQGMGLWEVVRPPVEIIAMTHDEEIHYDFIKVTGAQRVIPMENPSALLDSNYWQFGC